MAAHVPLLNGADVPPNSFVLEEHKIVYISSTKAASTTMRWMLADLAGEDPERFYQAPAPHQSRLMTIHTQAVPWQHVKRLTDLPAAQLADISRDNGWFIFGVVRDPWSRLWSAWQSKILVQQRTYVETYGDEPWFPRVPQSTEDVLSDWRAFIAARPWESNAFLAADAHFRPQARAVRPRSINYTRIYDLNTLAELFTDLGQHLELVGKPRELYLPRANDMPLVMTPAVLAEGVQAVVRESFRADFNSFHGRWSPRRIKLAPDGWSPDALRGVGFRVEANQRIGDLSRQLRRQQRRTARSLVTDRPSIKDVLGHLTGRLRRS